MLVFKLRFVNFTINEHDDDDDDDDIVFCLVTSNDEDKNTVRLDLRKHLSTPQYMTIANNVYTHVIDYWHLQINSFATNSCIISAAWKVTRQVFIDRWDGSVLSDLFEPVRMKACTSFYA